MRYQKPYHLVKVVTTQCLHVAHNVSAAYQWLDFSKNVDTRAWLIMGFVVVHAIILHERLALHNRIQVGSFPKLDMHTYNV